MDGETNLQKFNHGQVWPATSDNANHVEAVKCSETIEPAVIAQSSKTFSQLVDVKSVDNSSVTKEKRSLKVPLEQVEMQPVVHVETSRLSKTQDVLDHNVTAVMSSFKMVHAEDVLMTKTQEEFQEAEAEASANKFNVKEEKYWSEHKDVLMPNVDYVMTITTTMATDVSEEFAPQDKELPFKVLVLIALTLK
jgi:hypothetical protein